MRTQKSLQNYQAPKQSKFNKFFWWCCGADKGILIYSTHSDYVKYCTMGGVVFGTGLLAAISSGFAIYRIFDSLVASVILGFVWGYLIFNLDRLIVSSTGKGDGKHSISWSEFCHALPRLVMAFLIGITIAAPLEIKIFDTEIQKQWKVITKEEVQNQRIELESYKSDEYLVLKTELNEINSDVSGRVRPLSKTLNDKITYETQNGGCKGKCNEFKRRLGTLVTEEATLNLRQEELRASLQSIIKERNGLLKDFEITYENKIGILDSLRAIHEYPGSQIPARLLMFLLVAIEMAPIFFKMMLAYTPYDFMEENVSRIKLAEQGIEMKPGIYKAKKDGKHWDKVRFHSYERMINKAINEINTDKVIDKEEAKKRLVESMNRFRDGKLDFEGMMDEINDILNSENDGDDFH